MAGAARSERTFEGPAPIRTGPWSEEEIARLMELWNGGLSNLEISHRMGRRENAIAIKASRLNLPPKAQIAARALPGATPRNPRAKMRPCLTCSRQFFSEGAGHRICDACKSSRSWGDDYVVQVGGGW
jgi:hypothetical protein